MSKKTIIILISAALLLKFFLFSFAVVRSPEAKVRIDSSRYIESGLMLVSEGVFGTLNDEGAASYQFYRTPGYPLFLGILHGMFKISLDGVILVQILLTICSALIVRAAATKIDQRLGWIAFFIILFDPAITVISMMLLTESLFLLCVSIFIYAGISYFKEKKKRNLLWMVLALGAGAYVRPISFYLGAPVAVFMIYAGGSKNIKQSIIHACVFLLTVHSLLFVWQWRNHNHFNKFKFSSIDGATINHEGLYKSYARNKDPYTQGASPFYYYLNVSTRCVASLFTRPISLKYFGSDILKKIGKVLSYPWILFWLAGLIIGIFHMGKNVSFHFLFLIILYFSAVTVVGAMWGSDARFRIPMMPAIAILSSYGWQFLLKKSK